jgi:hypothetical protein
MIIAIIGYFILFMAVDYGRKDESKIPFLSWKWLIILSMIVFGTYLVNIGHRKEETKPKIRIENQKETKIFQQTYLVE